MSHENSQTYENSQTFIGHLEIWRLLCEILKPGMVYKSMRQASYFVVTIMLADDLILFGARLSAGITMTKFWVWALHWMSYQIVEIFVILGKLEKL